MLHFESLIYTAKRDIIIIICKTFQAKSKIFFDETE